MIHDFKGKFEIFEEVSGNKYGKKLGESYNRMVYDGMEYIMDFAFGVESWHSGAAGYDGSLPASGAWHPFRYVAIGTSADNNDDWLLNNSFIDTGVYVDAPTGGSGILLDSVGTGLGYVAHFPNLGDSRMSSVISGKANKNVGTGLFYKVSDRVVRTARTVTIEATFTTDSDADNGTAGVIPTGTKIRELGVFLSNHPTGAISPSTIRGDRPNTMICKSVRYQISGGYIQDNAITAGANNLTVRYSYGDIA